MNQIIFNILYSSSIITLIAISFNFIFISTKFLNLAHAAIITFAGYFCHLFYNQLNLSIWIAVILGLVFSVIISLFIELSVYRILRKSNTPSSLMLIASLGIYVILQNCISMFWGDDTKTIRISDVKIGNEIIGIHYTNIQLVTIILSTTLFILAVSFLKFHKTGRNIRAIFSNIELVNIQGINSNQIILWSCGISSFLAAIVGLLIAFDNGFSPSVGFNLLLYGIVATVIGGVGSTWGIIGGALLLATAQHLGAYFIDSKWMDAITYIILILFLIWRPLGFSGKQLKKTEI